MYDVMHASMKRNYAESDETVEDAQPPTLTRIPQPHPQPHILARDTQYATEPLSASYLLAFLPTVHLLQSVPWQLSTTAASFSRQCLNALLAVAEFASLQHAVAACHSAAL